MKIVVCLKRVVDTAAAVKISGDAKSLDTSGLEFVISPYDEYAIEEALKITEASGEGEVVVVCLGPAEATKEIKTALAMGAHRAIHLVADTAAYDPAATARALTEAIKAEGFDLILCGKQATDDDAYVVPAYLAVLLGVPVISVVQKLDISEGAIRAERQVEGGSEVVESPLPAIVTCQKGLNEPRYPSLKGIMKAKKKPVDTKDAPAPEKRVETLKIEYPPKKDAGRIVGEGVEAVAELVRCLKEEAKLL